MQAQPTDFRISPNETNITKGIAICAMLIHHLFNETNTYGYYIQQIGIVCKVCVSLFLFVSGHGMTIQYSKLDCHRVRNRITSTLKFLLRRLIKFYLNYWAIFIIIVPLGVFAFGRTLSIAYGTDNSIWSSLIKDILGIQGAESYIVTWWFNALIISLYLLFPLLHWLMKRKSIAIGFIVLLFLWPRNYIVNNFFYIFYLWNSNLALYTLVFVLGIFSAQHIKMINFFLNKIKIQLVFTFSSLAGILLCFSRRLFAEEYADQITLDAFITTFVVLSIVAFCRMTRLKLSPLAVLGKHSINIYLIHTFILMFFFPKFIFECKCSPIIFIALLGESFAASTTIEFIKRKTKFYKLQDRILNLFSIE